LTIIKLPPSYDISHHKRVPDFLAVDPKPYLFITKASEAHLGTPYIHTDDKFIEFATGMMLLDCFRGFYHFNRRAYGGYKQAKHFISVISQIDILSTDILILDFEDGKEKASELWAWHEEVKEAFPNNLRMNYSTAMNMNSIVMTESEKAYFKKIPFWPAGYPIFPDLFTTVPKMYTPDPTKAGPVLLWQYTGHGRVTGIVTPYNKPTDVDLNLVTPALQELLGTFQKGEMIMASYKGVCETVAKVWEVIGGKRVYPDVKENQTIRGDAEKTVAGKKYLHLTSPIVGWSVASWFTYTVEATPVPGDPPTIPPPIPDPVITLPEYLTAHKADGTVLGTYDLRRL